MAVNADNVTNLYAGQQLYVGMPLTTVYLVVSNVPTTGLAGYWRCDEGTGTTTADASGNGNTGTLGGTPVPIWTNGIANGGLYFSPHATVLFASDLYTNINDCSIIVWAKNTGSLDYKAFVDGQDGNAKRYIGMDTSGNLYVQLHDSGGYKTISGPSISSGWHDVALTKSSMGGLIAYVDGTPAGTNANATGAMTWDGNAALGGSASYPWTGCIDDVRIFSRVLNPTEILQLHNNPGKSQ